MAEVSPLRGIRYNRLMVEDLGRVLCPPYDVITPEQQELLCRTSEYNAVRLESPACGTHQGDGYQMAAATYRKWLDRGILQRDRYAGFYLHDHHFEWFGEKRRRRGLIARVSVDGRGVYPHEATGSAATSDRLKLLRACRASFSPVLSLYHDSGGEVSRLLSEACTARPLVEVPAPMPLPRGRSIGTDAHVLWSITDQEAVRQLARLLSTLPLYIADGHHRYETASAYCRERAAQQAHPPQEDGEGFRYVMMELVDCSDPGLVVRALHRLVRNVPAALMADLEGQLGRFFILEPVPLRNPLTAAGDLPSSVAGVLGLRARTLVLLKPRHDASLLDAMPGRSRPYRESSVAIVSHIILDRILGLTGEEDVAYTPCPEEASAQVRDGTYQLAFLVDRPHLAMVRAIADAGERMPGKSTYFYPKAPAGLIINSLEGLLL